jgi:hypothetical protein
MSGRLSRKVFDQVLKLEAPVDTKTSENKGKRI